MLARLFAALAVLACVLSVSAPAHAGGYCVDAHSPSGATVTACTP